VTSHSHIVIVGGGIGGLACALALQQRGFRPRVLERATEISEIGAGLQISPNAACVLDALGLTPALETAGCYPEGIHAHHWENGRSLAHVRFADLEYDAPYIHIHRADLVGALLAAVRANDPEAVQEGCTVDAVENGVGEARVILKNGDWLRASWVIAADGIHSHLRDFVCDQPTPPRFTGNVAWRGLIPVDRLPTGLQPPKDANIWMGPGAHVVMYYVRRYEALNFIGVTERDNWQQESWTEKASLKDMLGDFAGWDTRLFQILAHADPNACYRWALFDRDPLPRWYRGRVMLLGDAVHPMLPFVAQGAAQAIEDAWVLADALARWQKAPQFDPSAWYQAQRAPRCDRIQRLARDNMKLFHERRAPVRMARDLVAGGLAAMSPKLAARRVDWIYRHRS